LPSQNRPPLRGISTPRFGQGGFRASTRPACAPSCVSAGHPVVRSRSCLPFASASGWVHRSLSSAKELALRSWELESGASGSGLGELRSWGETCYVCVSMSAQRRPRRAAAGVEATTTSTLSRGWSGASVKQRQVNSSSNWEPLGSTSPLSFSFSFSFSLSLSLFLSLVLSLLHSVGRNGRARSWRRRSREY